MAKSAAQRAPKENILLPVILSALQDEQRGAMHIFSLSRCFSRIRMATLEDNYADAR